MRDTMSPVKWLIVIAAILGLCVWVSIKPANSQPPPKAAASTRVTLDQNWRNKPEREMTIAEMESWARQLNDEKLWQELEKSTREWLDINGGKKWNDPPRLSVMLAREFGRRNGEDGIRDLVTFIRKSAPSETDIGFELREAAHLNLRLNLSYAALGGWTSEDPDGAISRLLQTQKFSELDPWENKPDKGDPIPVFTLGRWVIPGQDSIVNPKQWAYERVMRSAFSGLVQENQNRAIELFLAASKAQLIEPTQVIEAILPRLDHDSKKALWKSLEEIRIHDDYPIPFLDSRPWHEDLETDILTLSDNEIDNWSQGSLFETLARARPKVASNIILSLETQTAIKERIFPWLGVYHQRTLELFKILPPRIQRLMIDTSSAVTAKFRQGPIDGKEGGFIPDWEGYHETFIKVVNKTDLEPDLKASYLETIKKNRDLAND
jgi:hypothetical protein